MIRKIKSIISKQIKRVAQTHELDHRIGLLEAKQKIYWQLLALAHGEKLQLPETTINEIRQSQEQKLAKSSYAISPNDLMLHFILFDNGGNISLGLKNYFDTGLQGAKIKAEIAKAVFGEKKTKGSLTILDFASGYGRVSRYLPQFFAGAKVFVSDIKPKAVNFQEEQLGVKGFSPGTKSFTDLPELDGSEKFDLITVDSLFSHLPEQDFAGWLEGLIALLKEDGLLIFSTHDPSLSEEANGEFSYFQNSEDMLFSEVEDSLGESENYGVTYVSLGYVQKLVENLGFSQSNLVRFPKALWNGQDEYVFSKKELPEDLERTKLSKLLTSANRSP
ncbi:MAG: class I SAM-dependent methyltransferase [Candidatus Dojkabacteria bacterium]